MKITSKAAGIAFIFIIIIIDIALAIYAASQHVQNIKKNLNPEDLTLFITDDNSSLLWGLRPNTSIIFRGQFVQIKPTKVTINDLGFRDFTYNLTKQNNTFRIIVLGDSYTFGWGVEMNETFSKVLERKLNMGSGGTRYEVMNLGVPGYDATQEAEMYRTAGARYNPDLVIIGFCSNDVESSALQRELYEKLKDNSTLKALYGITDDYSMNQAIQRMKEKQVADLGEEKNWEEAVLKPYSKLANLTRRHNISVVVYATTFSKESLILDIPSQIAGWTAAISSADLSNPDNYLNPQDQHPNKKAHSIYADELYDLLIKNKLIPGIPPEQERSER